MLKRLNFRNFKSWSNLDLEFGRVTGLFGANSSGKSSIIQFLLMLKQTKNATDRRVVLDLGGADQFINLGTFEDMVHRHDTDAVIDWTLSWQQEDELTIPDIEGKPGGILFSGRDISSHCRVSQNQRAMKAHDLFYEFDGTTFSLSQKEPGQSRFQLEATSSDEKHFQFRRNQGRAWSLPGPIKTHLFPDQAKTYFQNSDPLWYLESAYEDMMDRIFYLGPLREYPKRQYQWAGASPIDVGRRGERTVDAILAATSEGFSENLGYKKRHRGFQEIISFWLQELGLVEEFSIQEIAKGSNLWQARLRQNRGGAEVLLTDIGFGVSQVLPALVLLYYVPKESIVVLEQPEIHLHPAVQSGLADVILNVAKTRNVQILVESHSEHLLRRLQRRVAEDEASTNDTHDMIKLYFCDSNQGASSLRSLHMDIFGRIENWPDNFFGDEFDEIAATQIAAQKRRMAAG